jgi:hypothetical protein
MTDSVEFYDQQNFTQISGFFFAAQRLHISAAVNRITYKESRCWNDMPLPRYNRARMSQCLRDYEFLDC